MSLWKRLFGGGKSNEAKTQPDSASAGSDGASSQHPAAGTAPSTAGATHPLTPPQKTNASGPVGPAVPHPSTAGAMHPLPSTPTPNPTAAAKDRVVRVFISSTFKDMIEDRNELMSQVWPALRKACRGRAVEFVEVDLRWGVTEEQSQRKETLRHCLAEIKRCKPYFIGLLGERYGGLPGPEAFSPALLDEEGWLKNEVAKHSFTELEILHGVLNDPDMAGRAFFYFRDPQYSVSKGGDYLPEDTVRPIRQDALKQKVKAVCAAKQIPLRENYADPRALAALVLADLTAAIDAEFPPDQVPDVWSREDRDHEAYAKSRRTSFYVGRDAYFTRLDTFARDGAEGCGLTVLGESGGGKSALLANWVALWRQAHSADFVFQHYIGSSAMSAGHLALMRRLMVAIVRWCGADAPAGVRGLEEEEKKIPATAGDIVKAFPDYLNRLVFHAKQKGGRAILVFDALNQLEDRERGRLLAWLPYRLPGELRLIVSTLPGDTLQALQPRGWSAITVEPLTAEERVQLIARYLTHFAQGLSDARAKKIAAVPAASNPLYIKTLLDDLRATGDHQLLDQQIAYYLQAADIPALLGKILTRFERDYERDRPGLVREALSLLWAARRGLTEPELLHALRPNSVSQSTIFSSQSSMQSLPAVFWSPVRFALEDGLVDRDGVLAFAHEHLRMAVERRYVSEAGAASAMRLRLADDFAARPVDARQAVELPWLLRQAESRDRLHACLLDIDRFLLMQSHDENELLWYWIWLKEERTMGQTYVQAFEQWTANKRETIIVSSAASRLASFLSFRAALHAEAEPLMRRALKISEQICGQNRLSVASDINNLAQLLRATNRLTEAEPLMRRALNISEESHGQNHPSVADYLCNLAQWLKEVNRLSEAEPLMRRALTIDEQSYGENHPRVARGLSNLAQLLQSTNRLAEAEPLMRRALKSDEQSYGENHPSVAIRLNNLAGLFAVTNHRAEAEPLYRRVLRIDEQSYGPDHPEVAMDLNNLATLLKHTNRLEEAESLYRRALQILENSLGSENSKVATPLSNLAELLQSTNRMVEAEPLMRRALMIAEQCYQETHPFVIDRLSNLFAFLYTTNRLAEAEPLMRRTVEILLKCTRAAGKPHVHLQNLVRCYAVLLQEMGRNPEQICSMLAELGRRYGVCLTVR